MIGCVIEETRDLRQVADKKFDGSACLVYGFIIR
jgi:hypothetical protein